MTEIVLTEKEDFEMSDSDDKFVGEIYIIERLRQTQREKEIQKNIQSKSINPTKEFQRFLCLNLETGDTFVLCNKNMAWLPKQLTKSISKVRYRISAVENPNYEDNYELQTIQIVDVQKWSNQKLLTYIEATGAITSSRLDIIRNVLSEQKLNLVEELTSNFKHFKKLLMDESGIGEKTINHLKNIVLGQYDTQKLKRFIEHLNHIMQERYPNFSTFTLRKSTMEELLIRAYGNIDKVIRLLTENPYAFVKSTFDDEEGPNESLLSFYQADVIYFATNELPEPTNKHRIDCYLQEIFKKYYQKYCATYMKESVYESLLIAPEELNIETAYPIVFTNEEMQIISERIENANYIVRFMLNKTNCYALKGLFEQEETCSKQIRLRKDIALDLIDEATIYAGILDYELANGFQLTDEQKLRINQLVNEPIICLTGYAGTGKSTIVGAALSIFKKADLKTHCCAFTGKAAKNLSQITSVTSRKPAQTIHKTVLSNDFIKNNHLNTDVLVIDEISMCPLYLLNNLLELMSGFGRILLIGDAGQLDPINSINVLSEFEYARQQATDEPLLEIISLTKPQRQSATSTIYTHANALRQGKLPEDLSNGKYHWQRYPLTDYSNQNQSKYFIMQPTHQGYIKHPYGNYEKEIGPIPACVANCYEQYLQAGVSANDIQILSPTRSDAHEFNQLIQGYLFQQNRLNKELFINFYKNGLNQQIYVGDRIINQKNKTVKDVNNSEETVYFPNGAVGYVTEIFYKDDRYGKNVPNISSIYVQTENMNKEIVTVELTTEDLQDIDLAYAITVHKAQGSTIPYVIFSTNNTKYGFNQMFNRKLCYTAYTRAKTELTIVLRDKALLAFTQDAPTQQSTLHHQMLNQIQKNN